MSNLKKILGTVVAFALVAAAALGMDAGVRANAEETAVSYSVKEYTPDKYDWIDFYGGVGDINPEDGDGVTTFAHAGLLTPLEGENIEFDTSFTLLSKKAVEEGGAGVDAWVTYSFSKVPAEITSDGTIPSYASGSDDVFLHITNYSGTTAPNCVEVQVVQRLNGETVTLDTKFVDNAVGVRTTFRLAKGNDGNYTWTLQEMGTDKVLYTLGGLAFDTAAFVNDHGQTYFSTAIYEGPGCDGNHWEHRGVSVYGLNAYTADITADCVTLSPAEYTYQEGNTYSPEVTVTIGGETLINGEDYTVTYENNNAVGTATAKVTFYGEYGGNIVEKDYLINAPAEPEDPDDSKDPEDSKDPGDSGKPDDSQEEKGGCGSSVVAASMMGVVLVLGGVALFLKKRD